MKFTYDAIDLFSGCGGVSCGLTMSGFTVKAAVEIEEKAIAIYSAYKPLSKVKVLHDDICKVSGEAVLKAGKIRKDSIYLLAGCPPCQNFSRQNPKNRKKTDEERKKLLFEFLRIINELKPPFVLMENVPGIKDEYNKAILDEFLENLTENYDVIESILNAADYGVPQLRKRFVLHAVRKDIKQELDQENFEFSLPRPTHAKEPRGNLLPWRTVREAIGDLPKLKAGETFVDPNNKIFNHKCANLKSETIERMQIIRENGGSRSALPEDKVLDCHKKKNDKGETFGGHGDVYGIMSPDKPSPTMTGGCLFYSKGRYGHYEQDRAISIREAARLQTFPDDFVFGNSLTDAALQIGNAVPVDLVKASGRVLKEAMCVIKKKRQREKDEKTKSLISASGMQL